MEVVSRMRTDEKGGFGIQRSYIVQRMPCMVCYRISIVLAFLGGRAKTIFDNGRKHLRFLKYPYMCINIVLPHILRKIEENVKEGAGG